MNPRCPVHTVTFDVGGTLISPTPSVGHVYAEMAGRFGVKADGTALTEGFKQAWKAKTAFDYSEEAWYGLVRNTFGPLAAKLPDAFFPALYRRFIDAEVWQIHDDALEVLDELASRDFNLGVISNWDERLRPLLKNLKLTPYFQAITVSCEVQFPKPEGVIFEQALRSLGAAPGAVLHVGDSRLEDAEGARSAGLHGLHLDRKGGGDIRALTEVPGWLERLRVEVEMGGS
ncbi:MAG TPA: HAD-IA family hydrolase [Verrucomicrobiae bacterium]